MNKSTPEASKLLQMVDYQDSSVTSRVVMKSKGGSVTLFAFDKGEELSEHTAPFDAMVDVLDGEVEITISGAPYHLKTGEMIVMPAGEPHALKAVSRFKMLLVMLRSEG